MAQALLLDTDLLIDFLRGQRQAVVFMEEETRPMAISALTAAELHAGVRDGAEKDQLTELLSIFNQIPVDPETALPHAARSCRPVPQAMTPVEIIILKSGI